LTNEKLVKCPFNEEEIDYHFVINECYDCTSFNKCFKKWEKLNPELIKEIQESEGSMEY